MDIIAGSSDKKVSYNSVKMTQKSCFLMVAITLRWDSVPAQLTELALGPGYVGCYGT